MNVNFPDRMANRGAARASFALRVPGNEGVPVISHLGPTGGALVILCRVWGQFFRAPGAMMAVNSAGAAVGSISAGCLDAELALRTQEVMATGEAQVLRYGKGSPFIDIVLPCGAGVELVILPVLDPAPITAALDTLAGRQRTCLTLWETLTVEIAPRVQCHVHGDTPAAATFERLADAAGLPVTLNPPRDDRALDPWTAVVSFFHDHDKERDILTSALASRAFWIGAIGSPRTHTARTEMLRQEGLSEGDIARVRGPIGLIPRAKSPNTLAVSVLAEIMQTASA